MPPRPLVTGVDLSDAGPEGPAPMPLLSGSVSLFRYRVVEAPAREETFDALRTRLAEQAFVPIERETGEQERAAGWVELGQPEAFPATAKPLFYAGDLVLSWRIDQIRVPGSLVKSGLDDWQRGFVERRGRKPSKREKTEQKEFVLRELRKQAFVTSRTHDVRWSIGQDEVQVWSTSLKVVDEVVVALEEGLSLVLRPTGPGARWEDAELPMDVLKPTAALFGEEVIGGI